MVSQYDQPAPTPVAVNDSNEIRSDLEDNVGDLGILDLSGLLHRLGIHGGVR